MAQRGIREYEAKKLMAQALPEHSKGEFTYEAKTVLIGPDTDLDGVADTHPWVTKERLVAKPDQLFGKRGKNNLLFVDKSWDEIKQWIAERMNQQVTITQTTGTTNGVLTHFLVEQFVPHEHEYYVAITTNRDGDTIHFSVQGGVDIEEVWDTVVTLEIPILSSIEDMDVETFLPDELGALTPQVANFVKALYRFFVEYHFTYLELNPFTMQDGKVVPLDAVAKVDDYASYQCAEKWGALKFPPSFGMPRRTEEEEYVSELDERTGASLKVTLLNPNGRVWNLVAGGGASVIYADTVADLGYAAVLYPVTLFRVAMKAVEVALSTMIAEGTQASLLDLMQTRAELYELLDYEGLDERDAAE